MPYTPTSWVSGTTPVDATEMNNLETQYSEATQSFEQDLLTAFVLSGLVATKDGTVASQLDVTAGVAFLKQTDNTLRRRAPTSSTQSCTGHPSTTLYLDLNPDGTWSFATTHSAQANYLTVCTVTTDASANILTVTDTRTLTTTLLSGAAGAVTVNGGVASAVPASGVEVGYLPTGVYASYATATPFTVGEGGTTTNGFQLGRVPGASNPFIRALGTGTGIGFKRGDGTPIAEMRGDFVISGTTFWTTQGSSGFNHSSSFDTFDVAEVYAAAERYAGGTVVCPGDDGVMRRCEHDGCHAALIVSVAPGLALGNPDEVPETAVLAALAGRVRVAASGQIAARALVTADGAGSVRAMRAGESGFALGVALHAAQDGSVGVLIRSMWCKAPGRGRPAHRRKSA